MAMEQHSVAAPLSGKPAWVDNVLYFEWWSTAQHRFEGWHRRRRWSVIGCVLAIGVLARLWAQTLTPNWDFHQWVNISTAALDGRDPYSEFAFNYPQPWLSLVTLVNVLTTSDQSFRLLLAAILTLVDIGIAYLLVRRGYSLAACLFFLSPVIIAISGQHQQVEGIAVLLALWAVTLMSTSRTARIGAAEWCAAGLLGLSLAFKPVFLLLPLWLAIRPGPWRRRVLRLAGPIMVFGTIFAISFVMYPANEVVRRVLGHSGTNNSPFANAFIPRQLAPWFLEHGGGKVLFLAVMIGAAFLFRRLAPFESALAYTVTAVTFSWAIANQYLAGPMAAVAIFLNLGFLLWLVLASLYLIGEPSALNVAFIRPWQQHVFLDWQNTMQDLFPWMFIGWVIFVLALRSPLRHYVPERVRTEEGI